MEERLTMNESVNVKEALEEIFTGIPKTKRFNYLGCLNTIYLFLEAVDRELHLTKK